jgi:putative metallopeptidase DUF4344
MRLLVCLVVAVFGVRTARAEILVVHGVELKIPDNWVQEAKGKSTLLHPKSYKGRAIDLVEVPTFPVDAEQFKKLVGDKLEDIKISAVTRDGIKLIAASGRVTAKGGKPVDMDILAVPVRGKAVLLISAVGADQDPLIRKANTEILLSARVAGPRMTASYETGKKTVGPPKDFIEAMTKIVAALDLRTRMPRALPVMFKECGQINAFYQPGAHAIQMCHDLYDDLVGLFKKSGADEAKSVELARGTLFFVFFHELGHALVGELGLPITGKGEDAADELATLVMIQLGAPGFKAALAAAQWFDTMAKRPGAKNVFYDEHSFNEQRVVSITCLLYGADQKRWAPLMQSLKIPDRRLRKCVADYPARKKAWDTLLAPYALKVKSEKDPWQ